MSVEEDVMKIQKKLTKMTSDDGTVSKGSDGIPRSWTIIFLPWLKSMIKSTNIVKIH